MATKTITKTKSYKLPVPDRRPRSNKFIETIKAGLASAGPPLGPKLGKYGINIAAFCKEFNLKTQSYIKGVPLPCVISVNPDRSFNMVFQKPSFEYYVKQAAGINSFELYKGISGRVTIKHIYEISKILYSDEYSPLQLKEFTDVCKSFVEKAYELGVDVVKDYNVEEYQKYLEDRKAYLKKLEEEMAAANEAKLLRG